MYRSLITTQCKWKRITCSEINERQWKGLKEVPHYVNTFPTPTLEQSFWEFCSKITGSQPLCLVIARSAREEILFLFIFLCYCSPGDVDKSCDWQCWYCYMIGKLCGLLLNHLFSAQFQLLFMQAFPTVLLTLHHVSRRVGVQITRWHDEIAPWETDS